MASVNKVILIGNCGKDPEIKFLPSGMQVAEVSLAVNSKHKDQSGNYIEDTQWFRLKFFDKLAEVAGQYVKQGNPIYIEGRISQREYTDKDGVKRTAMDIICNGLQLLGSRPEGQQQRPAPTQQRQPPAQQRAPAGGSGFDNMDDDIPW